jgi:hypothetical protein
MARHYAGILGALAFATALVHGIVHGAPIDATLVSATGCLLAFAAWGYVAGLIAAEAVSQAVRVRVIDQLQHRRGESPPKKVTRA